MKSIRELSRALLENDGNIPKAAEALGMHPRSVRDRIRSNPKLAKVIADLEADTSFVARGNIAEAIHSGDLVTSRWWLERRDPDFANSMRLKLTDAEIDGIVAKLPPEQLAKLASDA